MSIFSGLGRGLGAAAEGYGKGQRQGEQEAYNRHKADELLNLRKLAMVKPVKEDAPYPVKSLIDTHRAVMSSGNYQHINDWVGSGNAAAAESVIRAYAEGGPDAALQAAGIVTQPKGADTSSAMARLAGAAPASQSIAAHVQRLTGPPAAKHDYSYVQPSIDPNYQYQPKSIDEAREGNIRAGTTRIQALTPEEVANLHKRTEHIGFEEDASKRDFNLKAAQDDFNNALHAAQYRSSLGFKDYDEQRQTWSDLLNASARMYAHGGDPGAALKPFLFNKGAFGAQTINPDNAKRYLLSQGISEQDAAAIVGSARPGGLAVKNDQDQPNQAGAAGGPPVLPPVGGPTTNAGLAGAENFAQGQGFKVTSTTGGQHNPGSLHYQGRALDVGVNGKSPVEQKQFIVAAKQAGYTVRDERSRPKGQGVWSGPHVHIEWGGQGPPAALPGMTTEQVQQAMNPGGDPNAGPNAMGINTPATSPKPQNPWKDHPESLEGRVWTQVTGGRNVGDIQAEWKGTPYADIVQHVIDTANTQQREGGAFHAIPVASRLGAKAPEGTDFAGTLGYKDVGIPKVVTSSVEPSGGFGPGTPTPRAEMPPTPPPAPAPPPQGTPISTQAVAPPPAAPAAPTPSGGIQIPRIEMPAGPPLTGTGGRGPGGPSATAMPATPQGEGPSIAGTKKYKDLVANQPKVTAKEPADLKKADKNVQQELSRYKRHELAPGIQKWFSRHRIGDPKQQREVYQYAIGELGKEVAALPKGQRAAKMFRLLEQRLKPSS